MIFSKEPSTVGYLGYPAATNCIQWSIIGAKTLLGLRQAVAPPAKTLESLRLIFTLKLPNDPHSIKLLPNQSTVVIGMVNKIVTDVLTLFALGSPAGPRSDHSANAVQFCNQINRMAPALMAMP